jgi:hypothetical protein
MMIRMINGCYNMITEHVSGGSTEIGLFYIRRFMLACLLEFNPPHGLIDSHMLIIIYKSTDAPTVLTPAPGSRWLYLVAAVGFKVESEVCYYMY